MRQLTLAELVAGLDQIRQAPADFGPIELIVLRPKPGQRELVTEAEIDLHVGLVGDCWLTRGSPSTADGAAHPDKQLTLMSSRSIGLMAGERANWPLAGDQIYLDLNLSQTNLPAGTRLELGGAVVELSEVPHTGCRKFAARFGTDAVKFMATPEGKELRLRGVNARVIRPGIIRVGDRAHRSAGPSGADSDAVR